MNDPFILDPNELAVETFATDDPSLEPSQILVIETGCVQPCQQQQQFTVIEPA